MQINNVGEFHSSSSHGYFIYVDCGMLRISPESQLLLYSNPLVAAAQGQWWFLGETFHSIDFILSPSISLPRLPSLSQCTPLFDTLNRSLQFDLLRRNSGILIDPRESLHIAHRAKIGESQYCLPQRDPSGKPPFSSALSHMHARALDKHFIRSMRGWVRACV